MAKVILIHAHKDVNQLNQLIEVLSSPENSIYVNVDLKSDIEVNKINPSAKLIKNRIKIYWSDFSQVQAIINSLQEIENDAIDYEHIILISGQDFPIVSNAKINQALKKGKEYISYSLIAKDAWECEDRFQYFHFRKNRYQKKITSYIIKCTKFFGLKRRMIHNYKPFGGSSWWMLTKPCVTYILDLLRKDKKYIQFFKTVSCADELFFQTLILNSEFKENSVNTNYHYIDWTNCISSPNILKVEDFDKIIASDNLFCRKVELPESIGLIEKLKENRKRI